MLESTDETFEGFIAACHENPKKCPLAALHSSPEESIEAIQALFEKLKSEPLPVFIEGAPPFLIDYSILNAQVVSTLYRPNSYQGLAISLAGFLQGDVEPWIQVFGNASGIPQEAEAVMGIRCGDKIPRADKFSELDELEAEFRETSKYFHGFARGPYVYACARWPFEAKERYEGDFQFETANPILFIGNTDDPVTPLAAAKNMSSGIEGSVVLQNNGFGHTSLSQPSNCTNEVIAKYFADRTLPEDGKVCEPNVPLFGDDEEIPADGGEGGDDGEEGGDDGEEEDGETYEEE